MECGAGSAGINTDRIGDFLGELKNIYGEANVYEANYFDQQAYGANAQDELFKIYKFSKKVHLDIYSIAGEESALAGSHEVCEFDFPEDYQQTGWGWSASNAQMYLSADCTTLTVIMDYYDNELGSCVLIVNLNVEDPAAVKTENYVFLPGDIISTRMVEDQLLLTYNYRIRTADMDFTVPETFVPTYGVPGNMQVLPGEDIVCPDTAETARYTVVCCLDGNSLEVTGSAALLGYSQELYVSRDAIFATHAYTDESEPDEGGFYTITNRTQITGISYANGGLSILGSVQVDGTVKDQYSMDAYNGILRVVTTTRTWRAQKDYDHSRFWVDSERINADLYCVELSDWSVAASVTGFAPEGEEAASVRFDGDSAYVCTAEIVKLTDPVYFFDLSDPENITWTDTGTIDGYSTSLIQLGDGYLLGIGYGDMRQLKIEVYEQGPAGVESVCRWEADADFSEEYKSYLIDREKDLVGLGIWEGGSYQYVLLHFDGYELEQLARVELQDGAYLESIRAALIGDHLYILAPNQNGIMVEKLG